MSLICLYRLLLSKQDTVTWDYRADQPPHIILIFDQIDNIFFIQAGADPGFLERGFICIRGKGGGGLSFADLI